MLRAVDWRVEQQIRHPEDGVHGGPYFVAYLGKKVTFGLVCLFRGLFGITDHLFRLDSL